MSRKMDAIGLVGLCVTIAGTAGCPGGWPDSETLSAALDYETVLGGNENRIIFMKQEYPDLPPINWWSILLDPAGAAKEWESLDESYFLPTTRLVMVDLDSLTLTPVTVAGVAAQSYFWGQTDGRWLVWQSDEDEGVHVLNLETGAKSVVLQGLDGLWIDRIESGWLLAEVSSGAGIIVIARNLANGDRINLLVNTAGWGSSISGNLVAIQYFPDAFEGQLPGIIELEDADLENLLQSNVDVLDLTTRERRTVLSGLPDGTSATIGGDTIWIVHETDWNMTSLEAYDLQTGQTRSVALPPLSDPSADRYLEAAGPMGALVSTYWDSDDGSESRDLWELWTPDGSVQTIWDYTQSYDPFSWEGPVSVWPQSVGNLIVYQDPQTADWVLYDPATGDRQTVRPFE